MDDGGKLAGWVFDPLGQRNALQTVEQCPILHPA